MIPGPEDLFETLDNHFPFESAYEWDNSGWQLSATKPIERCLVVLDPSPDAIKKAVDWEAQLIVSHHPLFMPNISAINPLSIQGAITKLLLMAEIGLIAVHTNADRQLEGVSGALADAIGLSDHQILAPDEQGVFYKLVTFVPDEYVESVRSALASAGAGVIGNYEECSFSLAGTGTYRPTIGARPLVGKIGELEEVNEQRLEMRVAEQYVSRVLRALHRHHPYDEAAFDLYQTLGQGDSFGIGVIGRFPQPMEIAEAVGKVKDALGGIPLQVTGPDEGDVESVAVAGGSTSDLITAAVGKGAQMFVGGDLKYHNVVEYSESIVCVDAGHRASEQPGVRRLAEVLQHAAVHEKWQIEIEVFLENPAVSRVV